MFLLSIPKPCHENWDEMSWREQGAFCKVCAKTVVDFTRLSNEEVQNYILSHQGKKTCGRFRDDQLAEPRTLTELLSRPIPFWKKFLAIVFILFGAFLTSCNNQDQNKSANSTSSKSEQSYTTLGVTLVDLDQDTIFVEDHCTSTLEITDIMTEGIIEPPFLGDVSVRINEENQVNPDTSILVTCELKEEIKVDTIGKVITSLLKGDSIKKLAPPNNCDTIPIRAIEP
jgi:hypothetical protein